MKYRAALLTVVFVGFVSVKPCARAGYPVNANPPAGTSKSYQNALGPDLTKSEWKNWQAPGSVVNPDTLLPHYDISSNAPGKMNGFAPIKTDLSQLAKLFSQENARVEGS